MSIQDDLWRDYGPVINDLTLRFGFTFELASTGGGFYAITANLEAPLPTFRGATHAEVGDLIMVTDANDAGLLPLAQASGWGVGIYDESEQEVWHSVDEDGDPLTDIHDAIAGALYIRTTDGNNVRGRDYCEGCGAVVDQEHLPGCSVWLEQIRGTS